jgi:urea transport system ATP-binding protein
VLSVKVLNVYYGESHVVRDASFDVGDGETVAIMGRNGMGKSTLLKSLIGLLRARSGSVSLNGRELLGCHSFERVAAGLGYVPQGRMIFPYLTVEENILSGMETVADKTIPSYVYDVFPVLEEMKSRKAGNLSGGQQQQLAIARALVTKPKLLVLDEPTEGIQPSIIKDIGRAIPYLRGLGDIAIVLVEQYLDFAQELGDYFAVMDRGQIVNSSTRAEMDDAALKRALAI